MPNHRSSVMMLPKPSAEERTMTPQIKSPPIIGKLIDAFGNWRKHRQEIREIRDLNDERALEHACPIHALAQAGA
jgi:uncharacterized protein YjiS (DUF1127 family)